MAGLGQRLMGVIGLLVLVGIAWALSTDRRRFPLPTVLWGLGLQLTFGLAILVPGAAHVLAALGALALAGHAARRLRRGQGIPWPPVLWSAGAALFCIARAVAPRVPDSRILVLVLGAAALVLAARGVPWRPILWNLAALLCAALLLRLLIESRAPGRQFFDGANAAFTRLIGFTDEGARFVFGDCWQPVAARDLASGHAVATGFSLAFKALPVIIFFASLMSILYHLGVMQKIVEGMAWVMSRCMRVSGAESLVAATEVFVGMTEAPLAIRPYLPRLTESELLAVMTAGLANIAGSVLALYVSFGIDAGHLLCASVMSAPAALLIAKIMIPERGAPETLGTVRIPYERTTNNVIDAAAAGATDGLKLALNVATMLIAFLALLALVNYLLESAHGLAAQAIGWRGFPSSLDQVFAWVFRPLAWVIGIPWSEAGRVGSLLGIKTCFNELIAYQQLAAWKGELSERSVAIATYALCGFANFGSVAIQIGGVSALVPERRQDLSRLSLRALAGGTLATLMTACVAGILI